MNAFLMTVDGCYGNHTVAVAGKPDVRGILRSLDDAVIYCYCCNIHLILYVCTIDANVILHNKVLTMQLCTAAHSSSTLAMFYSNYCSLFYYALAGLFHH